MKRPLITDLEHIRARATELEEEDSRFRQFLKHTLGWGERRVDALVQETFAEVSAQIDCLSCANCCRCLRPEVTREDSARLARRLGLNVDDFCQRHLAMDEEGQHVMAAVPCSFLHGQACSAYADRPRDCRDCPHLDEPGFRSRTLSVLSNALAQAGLPDGADMPEWSWSCISIARRERLLERCRHVVISTDQPSLFPVWFCTGTMLALMQGLVHSITVIGPDCLPTPSLPNERERQQHLRQAGRLLVTPALCTDLLLQRISGFDAGA
jgi:hypothetical protein